MTDKTSEDIVERAEAARDRVVAFCMHGKGGALMAIPANPERDVDCVLADCATEIKRLRDERDTWKETARQNHELATYNSQCSEAASEVTKAAHADNAALRTELGHLARICRDILNRDESDPMAEFGTAEDQMHLNDAEKLLATDPPGQPLLDRLERYEKALEFYAHGWSGHPGDSGPGGNTPADPVWEPDEWLIEDGGKRARGALGEK